MYCKLLLCTVMRLLPLWLLFKHLTTVIVLYINYTPWWLLYYLSFFSKMVLADISSLITRFINNFSTVSVLIWEAGWYWQCEVEFCGALLLSLLLHTSRRYPNKPDSGGVSVPMHGWQSIRFRHFAADKPFAFSWPSGPKPCESDLWGTSMEMMD